jgi:pimeloyl-ACP methyl ester carboxylesterase
LIIPNCGHVPHREKPELTLDAIASFYQRVTSSRESETRA